MHQHKYTYTAALRRSVSKLDIKGERESELDIKGERESGLESKGESGVKRDSNSEKDSAQ